MTAMGQFFAVPKEPVECTITNGTLPGGLKLDNETGIITGVPREVGSFNVTIEARNEQCSSISCSIEFSVEESLAVSLGTTCLYVVIALCALFVVVGTVVSLCKKPKKKLPKVKKASTRSS